MDCQFATAMSLDGITAHHCLYEVERGVSSKDGLVEAASIIARWFLCSVSILALSIIVVANEHWIGLSIS